jgi:hypothetical protein
LISSFGWPLSVAAIVIARSFLSGRTLGGFLCSHTIVDISIVLCQAASFLLSPVVLIVGLFRTKGKVSEVVMPFVISWICFIVGFAILLLYVKAVNITPIIVVLFYGLLYSVAIVVWLKRNK